MYVNIKPNHFLILLAYYAYGIAMENNFESINLSKLIGKRGDYFVGTKWLKKDSI